MEEWKEYKLAEVCTKITDGSHSSPKAQESGYPMFSVKDMLEYGFDYSKCKYISQEDYVILKKNGCVPQKGDVLVAKDGSYLKQIFVCKETKEEAILSSIAIFRPNSLVDSFFLSYLLKSPQVYNYIANNCVSGSALPRIVLKDFKEVNLPIPSIEIQKSIVSILKSLDDKIEVNRRINENLEQQAQALFKSWFVDFEPFKDGEFVESELGMIPKGWRTGKLGEHCKCLLGGTPSRNREEYWNGNIAWINSGEVNKFRITMPSEYITEEGLNHSATKLLPRKTTVLAITGATLGQVSLLEIETCANQSVIGVLENKEYPYSFVYPLIKEKIGELMSHMTGGAQQHINKNNVEGLNIVIPSHDVMASFRDITFPIYDKIGYLCQENDRLAELRETLLPKLMSGELKVNELNI